MLNPRPCSSNRTRPRARRLAAAVGGALLAAVSATTAISAVTAVTAGAAASAASAVPSPATPAIKAPIQGLLDRHGQPPAAYRSAVGAFVISTTWAALQPVDGGPILHPNAIDTGIAQAAAAGEEVKLRVDVGTGAPDWAKTLGGAPMTFRYTDATAGKAGQVAGTIGRFWTPAFGAAYDDLQDKLAALYDTVPELREVSADRCQTIFSETYLRDAGEKSNLRALLAAGYTDAADATCHQQMMTEAAKAWQHTLTEIAFNPYQSISSAGKVSVDLPFTEQQMQLCRQLLGARCVLANYSLASGRLTGGTYGAMYTAMRHLGGTLDFQTATAAKIGNYQQVLQFAATLGGRSVELPTGYTSWPVATLRKDASAL